MAIVPNRPGAMMRRRVTSYSLAADVVVSIIVGLAISSAIGWILFFIGLAVTGFLYYNITQVMKTRGMR